MRRRRSLKGRRETNLVQLSTRVPGSVRRRVHLVCVEQGREVQDYVAEAIREYLRRRQAR